MRGDLPISGMINLEWSQSKVGQQLICLVQYTLHEQLRQGEAGILTWVHKSSKGP